MKPVAWTLTTFAMLAVAVVLTTVWQKNRQYSTYYNQNMKVVFAASDAVGDITHEYETDKKLPVTGAFKNHAEADWYFDANYRFSKETEPENWSSLLDFKIEGPNVRQAEHGKINIYDYGALENDRAIKRIVKTMTQNGWEYQIIDSAKRDAH